MQSFCGIEGDFMSWLQKFLDPKKPLIGSGHRLMNKSSKENFEVLVTITKRYGDKAKVWFGTELIILRSSVNA